MSTPSSRPAKSAVQVGRPEPARRRLRGPSLLLHSIDRRLGVLAEILDPCFLDARVVLVCLDDVDEVDDVRLKALLELIAADPSLLVKGCMRLGEREHV